VTTSKSRVLKFAAVDIGSNAVRMLFSQVLENGRSTFFKKDALLRIPLRLGEDAFGQGAISSQKADALIQVLTGFRHLIQAYQPLGVMACATSALREAENRTAILGAAEAASGIRIDVIDPRREAELIFANHVERTLGPDRPYLYIDVGGGSTELTLFRPDREAQSQSFDIGTIRLLKRLVPDERWREMKQWIRRTVRDQETFAIGSGGNINKIFRLLRKKEGKPVSLKRLCKLFDFLAEFSVENRIRFLNLRPDRADVIVLALEVFLRIMEWAEIKKIYVPQIGLSDGLIHVLYENHVEARAAGSLCAEA
jgi:exopolyphosphatase/guanosine-5'-triphosphate,3'-diphosphate pyrophosphatase